MLARQRGSLILAHRFVNLELVKFESTITKTAQADLFLNNYKKLVNEKKLRVDANQLNSVIKLNEFYNKAIYYEINNPKSYKISNLSLFDIFKKKQNNELEAPKLQGVYLYGGVGCGKTMLMDMFYDLMPNDKLKLRIHFNKFMQDIHKRMHKIRNDPSLPKDAEPFDLLAKELTNEVNLLFFDEFQVTDIADAMLMSRLFTALFKNGIVLFSTSNRVPNDLYQNGLQRALFLPFIDVLGHYCDVINLDSKNDYRKMSTAAKDRIYFNSDNENELLNSVICNFIEKKSTNKTTANDQDLKNNLNKLHSKTVRILGRDIELENTFKGLVDTQFSFMCDEARSAADYLRLAEIFDVFVVRNIPDDIKDANSLRRFIILVDTLYDHKIRLIFSGKADCVEALLNENIKNLKEKYEENTTIFHLDNTHLKVDTYEDSQINKKGASLFTLDEEIFAIDRTISRLVDMQSDSYMRKLGD